MTTVPLYTYKLLNSHNQLEIGLLNHLAQQVRMIFIFNIEFHLDNVDSSTALALLCLQDSTNETVELHFDATDTPLRDTSSLGPKGQQLCDGVAVYWIVPSDFSSLQGLVLMTDACRSPSFCSCLLFIPYLCIPVMSQFPFLSCRGAISAKLIVTDASLE